jgi:hypothetical protein
LVTTVSNLDGVVTARAADLTTLTTTVGGQTTSISNLTSTTDGIKARHGVEIDNNGVVTGYQLLSGEGGTSAFNIRADQFNVSAGGNFNNPIFAVRTGDQYIGGTMHPAGVYMTGYLSADKIIATTSIASPFADIGTVVAGTVTSADGRLVVDLDNGHITSRDASNNVRVKIGNLS